MSSYLPEEIQQPVRPREVVSTVLGVIVIVALCNFFVAPRLIEGGRNLAGWIISHKWHLLLRLNRPADDLILGDSSCNQGVNPVVLGSELDGDRVINLCTIGDMLVLNDAWMLETYIKRFGAPKRVILVHVYDIWNRSFDPARMGSVPVGLTTLRNLKPPVQLRRWQLRTYLESRYFPLYSRNLSLQARLRAGDPAAGERPVSRTVDSLGFLADTVAYPDSVEHDLQGHLRFLNQRSFHLSSDNHRALDRIATLAREHNFNVYLAMAPMYDSLASHPLFQHYYAAIHQALESFTGPESRIRLVFEQPQVFHATELQNADHVVLEAANRYTRALAAAIRDLEETRKSAGPTREASAQ